MKSRPHRILARRKALRRKAAKKLGLDACALAWRDGILTNIATGSRVAGVPAVEKPGATERRAQHADQLRRAQKEREERLRRQQEGRAEAAARPRYDLPIPTWESWR